MLLLIAGGLCFVMAHGMGTVQKAAAFSALALGAVLVLVSAVTAAKSAGEAKKAGFGSCSELYEAEQNIPEARAAREKLQKHAEEAGIRLQKAQDEYDASERECESLMPGGGIDSADGMYESYLNLSNLRAEVKASDEALKSFENANDIPALAELAQGAEKPRREREQIENEYRFASQSLSMLKDRLASARGKLEALKSAGNDPCGTETELLWTRSELESKLLDYDALCMAAEELASSGDEMKASVSPRISSRAGSLFSEVTDGKYRGIELDTRLYMNCECDEGLKSAEYLSAGTREAAYLCLRLALLELIYGERSVSVILDDAFAHTDDTRLKSLLRLFCESKNQIIMTSCTDREEKALDALGAEYRKIRI